jgi:zinc transport system substrate-binding protein
MQDDHAHDHGAEDPHAWLDPENARVWLSVMAEELAEVDPENADTYRANAEAARANLASLQVQISADLSEMKQTGIFVFHDAYQYFEHRFELTIAGAITESDDAAPGAARLETLHHAAEEYASICILAKPAFSKRLVDTVADGKARVQLIDPLGAHIPEGPDHYTTLLSGISDAISACGE